MGGRGAYSEGKQKEYVFKKAGEIDGVKVLVPVDEKASHNMPAEAHSLKAYIVLDKKNDVFRQYREFNEDHLPTFEIGYHFESGLSEKGQSVFHIHEYLSPGVEYRQKGRLMTLEEVERYKKYFKGVTKEQLDAYTAYYRRRNGNAR